MASEQKSVTLTIPAEVFEQLQSIANLKGGTVTELIPDLLKCYRVDWHKQFQEEIRAYVASLPPTPYTEEDVPRLIKEVRKELAAERQLESRP